MKKILLRFCLSNNLGNSHRWYLSVCILFVLMFARLANGQDSVIYLAHYQMRHVVDRAAPQDTMVESLLLFIGSQSTLWNSYKKLEYGHAYQMEVLEMEKLPLSAGRDYYRQPSRFVIDDTYLFHGKRKHIMLGYLADRYLFEREYPEPVWLIEEDQQVVMGLACQKATATFKGREWTAWFSPEIPVNAGPWLLHGLPGLIVVAEDRTGEVSFSLTALSADPATAIAGDPVLAMYADSVIRLPEDPKIFKLKESEFWRLKRTAEDNVRAYHQARRQISRFVDNDFSAAGNWSKVIKNPIDLEK